MFSDIRNNLPRQYGKFTNFIWLEPYGGVAAGGSGGGAPSPAYPPSVRHETLSPNARMLLQINVQQPYGGVVAGGSGGGSVSSGGGAPSPASPPSVRHKDDDHRDSDGKYPSKIYFIKLCKTGGNL